MPGDRQHRPQRTEQRVLMIGPSLRSRGGISSVCAEYERSGTFKRLNVDYLASFETGSAWTRITAGASAVAALLQRLLTRRVALVHVHMASGTSVWRKLVFCALARLGRRPYIVHLHSGKLPEYYEHGCGPWRRRLVATGLAHAASVLVLSDERRRWLSAQGLDQAPVDVLPNMVSLPETFEASREQPHTLLFLGRLEEAKGVSTLLQAFASVRENYPRARLLLGGEGDQARYEAQVRSLGCADAVQFLGWVDGEAKQRLLARAGVFVLPSRYEGLPMGILEAMSHATPCVATSVGGVPDMIEDGVNGRLTPVGDVTGLAAALADLLGSEPHRQALGLAARRTVEGRYSPAAVEAKLASIYRAVLRT